MLVSIIIPMYNVEGYIERCLESIFNQDMQEVEVILIDDGSVDRTLSICRAYEKKYDSIRLFQQVHSGQGDARNYGVQKAVGKYIVFADADDYYEPCAIEQLRLNAKIQNADVIFFDYQMKFENQTIHSRYKVNLEDRGEIVANMQLALWDKMFRSEFWKENNIKMSNRYGEDAEVDVFLIAKAQSIGIISKVLYNYVVRKDNMSAKSSNLLQMPGSLQNMLQLFISNGLFEQYEISLQYLCYYLFCAMQKEQISESEKKVLIDEFLELFDNYFHIPREFILTILKNRLLFIGNSKFFKELLHVSHYINMENYLIEAHFLGEEYDKESIYIIDLSKEYEEYRYKILQRNKSIDNWKVQCEIFSRKCNNNVNVFLIDNGNEKHEELYCTFKEIFLATCRNAKVINYVNSSQKLLNEIIKKGTYVEKVNDSLIIKDNVISNWYWDKYRLMTNQNLLNIWLQIKLDGDSFERYFIENNIFKVAIYGIGFLGQSLLKELETTSITVSYIIDQDKEKLNLFRVQGIKMEDPFPETDVIVVTPVHLYSVIYEKLQYRTTIRIISLQEIVDYYL